MDSASSLAQKVIGSDGEAAVAIYLESRGFTIKERNYLIRGGELDIIATRGDLGVFVEVKTRTSDYFSLSEVITPTKQRAIIRTAEYYLARTGSRMDYAWRFDVALVTVCDNNHSIEYIENAFYG